MSLLWLTQEARKRSQPPEMSTARYDPLDDPPYSVEWRVELADGSVGHAEGEGNTAEEALARAECSVTLVPSDELIDKVAGEKI